MDIQKEKEALIAEIEKFKEEALKMYFIESWSESYRTDPFLYAIDDGNKIIWMKAQARQLWVFWQQAQKVAVPEYCEIYLGMGLFVMCDWLDFEKIKNYKWNATSRKEFTQWSWAYDTSCETRKKVAMHNLIMNPSDGLFVDHINGNGLDNRRSNLRLVTKQQNCFNSRSKGGSSLYKGVSFDKQSHDRSAGE